MCLAIAETSRSSRWIGLFIALLIVSGWFVHLCLLFTLDLAVTPPLRLLGSIGVQTFLNTGLFITAHDAIHGLVYPGSTIINQLFGTFCATAYAALPYRTLAKHHRSHHRSPASAADPDFHALDSAGRNVGFFIWYQHFMRQYLGGKQFLCLACFAVVSLLAHLSPLNLIVLWVVPLICSSLQLFYFGTYCPHNPSSTKGRGSTLVNDSHARPWLLSFLACYHFSYHREHHDNPNVPWWRLPRLYNPEVIQTESETA